MKYKGETAHGSRDKVRGKNDKIYTAYLTPYTSYRIPHTSHRVYDGILSSALIAIAC